MKEIRCPYCDKIVITSRKNGLFSRATRLECKDDGEAELKCPRCHRFFSIKGLSMKIEE